MDFWIYHIKIYQNVPPITKTHRRYPKISRFVLATGKHQKFFVKLNKNNNKKKMPPLKYWEMGFPIYQIQMYEKTPPIVNYKDITQEIRKFVLQTEKHQKSGKKWTKCNKKKKIL